MLTFEVKLVLYYIGFGYLIVLAWLSLAGDVLLARAEDQRRRLRTIASAFLIAGVLHPAFALAGRDLIRQLRVPAGDPQPKIPTRSLDVTVLASVAVAAVVIWLVTKAS